MDQKQSHRNSPLHRSLTMVLRQVRGHDCGYWHTQMLTTSVINQESEWINGYSWMKSSELQFPAQSKDDIKLTAQERQMAHKECKPEVKSFTIINTDEVARRYRHSNYLIDPNSRNFAHIVCLLVIARRFIKRYLNIKAPQV